MPHWYSALWLGIFYSLWMGSIAVIPAALAALALGVRWPTMLLVLYYSIRYFYPPGEWLAYRKAVNMDSTPYCRTAKTILEDGISAPEPGAKALFCVHPHGVLTLGWSMLASCTALFDTQTTWLAADALFYLPFIRDLLGWMRTESCHKDNMLRHMKAGDNIALLPGGFEEATLFKRGAYRIFIKERKGFVKYALQYGYKLYPVFAFGEELTYYTVDSFLEQRLWFNRFKIPGVIFWSRLGFMPDYDLDLACVVGKPMDLPHIENPTDEDVNKHHAAYIARMQELFDKHKDKYGSKGATLEIF